MKLLEVNYVNVYNIHFYILAIDFPLEKWNLIIKTLLDGRVGLHDPRDRLAE